MRLTELRITQLRNLDSVSLQPHPHVNVLYGNNGSGKTSFLEAVYLLAHGRSFRSHINKRIINYAAQQLCVFAKLQMDDNSAPFPLAIQRNMDGSTEIRVDGNTVATIAALAKQMPTLLINPDSYELLDAGPKVRRQFLDWGLFHVEHRYFPLWQRMQRVLKQRNAALRAGQGSHMVAAWDAEFIEIAEQIDLFRQNYFVQLEPMFRHMLAKLIQLQDITLDYKSGWKRGSHLATVLKNNLASDMAVGYTQSGPQRADLTIQVNHFPAQAVLSRGQQKLVVAALRLAQAQLLHELLAKRCIYLIDDLPSELDQYKLENILATLWDINCQTFITTLEHDKITAVLGQRDMAMFHVEQGIIHEEHVTMPIAADVGITPA